MRKLLALTLSLLLVFSVIPMAIVSAEDEYKTMYDWEDGSLTGSSVVTVNNNKVSRKVITATTNTNIKNPIATSLVNTSTKAVLVNGGYSPNTMVNKSYVAFKMNDDFKQNGTSLRIAYRVGRSGGSNMAFSGVKVGGVAYFKQESNNYSYFWYNPVGKTYKTPDGSLSITITEENLKSIEAFLVANTTGYEPECSIVDDIQYTIDESSAAYKVSIDGEEVAEVAKGESYIVPTPREHTCYVDSKDNYYYGGEVVVMNANLVLTTKVETTKVVYTMDEGSRMVGASTANIGYGKEGAEYLDVDGDMKLALKVKNDQRSVFQLPGKWSNKPYYKPVKITFEVSKNVDVSVAFKNMAFSSALGSNNATAGDVYTIFNSTTYVPNTFAINVTEDMYDYKYITGQHYAAASWSESAPVYTYIDNVTVTYEYDFDYVAPEIAGETTDVITTDDKASIRLGEVNGIRFYTTIDTAALAELVGDKKYEVGTLIAPKDIAGDYLTIEDDHIKVVYDMTNGLWKGNQVVGSIVNIRETDADGKGTGNLARDFVARAYVLVDGVYYYSATQSVRNIAGIADAYINTSGSGYDNLAADTKALVDAWAKAND